MKKRKKKITDCWKKSERDKTARDRERDSRGKPNAAVYVLSSRDRYHYKTDLHQ
jgi:hypothetical protein